MRRPKERKEEKKLNCVNACCIKQKVFYGIHTSTHSYTFQINFIYTNNFRHFECVSLLRYVRTHTSIPHKSHGQRPILLSQLHTWNRRRRRLFCKKFRLILTSCAPNMQSNNNNNNNFCLANEKYKSCAMCVCCCCFTLSSFFLILPFFAICFFVFFFLSTCFIHFMGLVSSNFNVLIITCHILMPIKRE